MYFYVSNDEQNLVGCCIRKYYWRKSNRTPVSRVTGGDTYHYTNKQIKKCNIYKQLFERQRLIMQLLLLLFSVQDICALYFFVYVVY